jgi:hypothetical protein
MHNETQICQPDSLNETRIVDILSYNGIGEPIPEGKKRCTKCRELQPLSEYYRHDLGRYGKDPVCKKCRLKALNDYNAKNRILKPYYYWAREAIHNHKIRGFIVNINKAELEELAKKTTHCPMCGCELCWDPNRGQVRRNSPSLDRKYNGNRITLSNVWIICYQCNAMKQNVPFPEYVEFCKSIVDKFGDGGQ